MLVLAWIKELIPFWMLVIGCMCEGGVRHWTETETFVAFVETFQPGYCAPMHDHRLPYCSLVLRGGYDETSRCHEATLTDGSISLHPDSEHHAKAMSTKVATSEFYLMVADAELGQKIRERTVIRNPNIEQLLLSALFAVSSTDPEKGLMVESSLSEIVEESGKIENSNKPAWLENAVSYLHDNVGVPVGLTELSEVVGIDRSYLARNFRSRFRQTVGEYHRNLRLNKAARSIIVSDVDLGQAAIEHGFADQSHLGRAVRSAFGQTPSGLRRICPL